MFEDKTLTRREVEEKVNKVGDYVKMDYLQACLKKSIDFDTKKFVLVKLAELYEQKGMFGDAAKMLNAAAEINTTYLGKMNDFMKVAELYLRCNSFNESDVAFQKALACGNDAQKVELKIKRKEAYKKNAQDLMKKDRRKHAMDVYEKLLTLDLNTLEKKEVKNALLMLYEKLGKVREFYNLKRTL